MSSSDDDTPLPSTQPYLLRALHEWCTDNGLTPFLAVKVDGSVRVPPEFVRNGEIVLNISYDATSKLQLGNDYIEFQARFGGVLRHILVPVHRVMAIYARENGQGMAFSVPDTVLTSSGPELGQGQSDAVADDAPAAQQPQQAVTPPAAAPRPVLRAVPPPAQPAPSASGEHGPGDDGPPPPSAPGSTGKRPALRRIK
ncbi:ClpXP protease specificity-enhancing factor [Vandammella animalimorsus]|uniref:ClpXP protease specificity-enhancing factor n=1 Tax=Vandammella animalimorsus TaxID=2029117 RepID=A0A2A2AGU1_9BURK|nr:ClpXP protease specificity-enhancing factor [Vandammella animalimorsus]PAT37026.1 ClpXP protease specificity-enhancing factor [Vandammella animalimorsus]